MSPDNLQSFGTFIVLFQTDVSLNHHLCVNDTLFFSFHPLNFDSSITHVSPTNASLHRWDHWDDHSTLTSLANPLHHILTVFLPLQIHSMPLQSSFIV